jgi:hypothetical protein
MCNLSRLIELLQMAEKAIGDAPVRLAFEDSVMQEGFDSCNTESITDLRLIEDWALPGKSLVTHEEKPMQLLILYGLTSGIDSSITFK